MIFGLVWALLRTGMGLVCEVFSMLCAKHFLVIFCGVVAAFLGQTVAASASVLRYDFNVVITSTEYYHWCFEDFSSCPYHGGVTSYDGPPLGTYGTGWITVPFPEDHEGPVSGDPVSIDRISYSILGVPMVPTYSDHWIEAFDPITSSITVSWPDWDGYFEATLRPGNGVGGGGTAYYEPYYDGSNFAIVKFRFFDVTVTDVSEGTDTEILPAPLPAGLPLIMAGIAALGGMRRLQRARRSYASATRS